MTELKAFYCFAVQTSFQTHYGKSINITRLFQYFNISII